MSGKVTQFEELDCWQAARQLNKEVFLVSRDGPLAKDFEMRNQLRRAALSSMNNIAEGFTRYHDKEFKRFLDIAQSSAAEVKSMLYLCEDLDYLTSGQIANLVEKVELTRKLTIGLIRYLDSK